MGKSGSIVLGIIMVAVMFVIFPIVMTSAHELQTVDYSQTQDGVTTGVGETTATVVLTEDLWNDSITHVVSIHSDNGNDTPAAQSYTTATNTLTVSGLEDDSSRTLVVTYKMDRLVDYTGMSAMVQLAPMLLFLGVIGAVLAGLYAGFKH